MKNAEVIARLNLINKLQQDDVKLPVKVGYALIRNRKAMEEVYAAYDEKRAEIMKDKQAADLTPEEVKEVNELLSIENEIKLHMITEDDLMQCDEALSLNVLTALDFMIKE